MQVACDKKYHLDQHAATATHTFNCGKDLPSTSRQIFLKDCAPEAKKSALHADLCTALVAANIPWTKLENPVFRSFLEKYCNTKIPCESTLRKNYLGYTYEEVLSSIRSEVGDSSIWISVDETTDANGRYIANMVIGKLESEKPTRPFLIASKPLEKTNGDTVAYFVNTSLKILYPSGADDEKVLLLYTDAAAYMHRAATLLKVFFPRMTHVTCLAHALHRVAEEVRTNFTEVNQLVSSVKKVFLKAPARVQAFKDKLPDVPLPPEPILTRWGTWLNAVDYFHSHFEGLRSVILELSRDEAESVRRAQDIFELTKLPGELAYISANYVFIADSIRQLETSGQALCDAVATIAAVRENIEKVPKGPVADKVAKKLKYVLEKNPGFKILESVAGVLAGTELITPEEIRPSDIPKFKFAPVTSVDVERSFSAYKLVLSDRRRSFTSTNLEMVLVSYCYHNLT